MNQPDRTIRAPWTSEQVTALNLFQQQGGMHPFTCGALHENGESLVLDATHAGWICPDPACEYTQDWAWTFMVERGQAAVPAVQSPADRAALRDRIADVLAAAEGWRWAEGFKEQSPTWQGYQQRADAVLAVLPEPVDQAVVRAETLREGADAVANHPGPHHDDLQPDAPGFWWDTRDRDAAAALLRRLAGEQPTPDEALTDRAAIERAFAERLAAELKGCCTECDACIEIAQHLAGEEQPAAEAPKLPPMDPVHILGIDADAPPSV